MRIKRLLAALLAAAMALTLFAGCCSPSLLQLLLDLLQEQYQNITVTAEDDLDAALRAAVSEYDTLEEMDAALAQTLDKTVEFESLRSARAGDKTFDLVFRPGRDTEAMARLTYTEWNKILGSLPASGQYLADLAVRKADGGYYILVDIAVTRGGSSGGNHNSSDDEEENGGNVTPPATQPDYEWKEDYTVILVHTNKGLQDVFFDEQTDQKLVDARADGFRGITIQLENNQTYMVDETFETQFEGVLTSKDTNKPATIQLSDHSMFSLIGDDGNTFDPDCIISYINFVVTGTITSGTEDKTWNGYSIGVVANQNSGIISHCNITFERGAGVEAASSKLQMNVGSIAGYNFLGTIEFCDVQGGSIEVDVQSQLLGVVLVGGITGYNDYGSTVKSCTVSDSSINVDIPNDIPLFYDQNNLLASAVAIGGVVGLNTQWSSVEDYNADHTNVELQYAPDNTGNVPTSDYIAVDDEIGVI